MLAQMSPRERTLALLVGGVLLVLVNLILIKFFLQKHGEFQKAVTATQAKIDALKQRESQRTLWAERDAWLTQKLQTMGDPQVENRQLGEVVKEVARKHSVLLENPNYGVPRKEAGHTTLGYRISAKGAWEPMMDFLRELQGPGQFISYEPLEVKVDPSDKTLLRADLTVTKWFRAQP